MICKACGQEIEDEPLQDEPLLVLEGLTGELAYFHGLDCWNRYKSMSTTDYKDYKPDSFIPNTVKRRL